MYNSLYRIRLSCEIVICRLLVFKKEREKAEAYSRWKNGKVQVIVAFGSDINKSDVRL